MIGRLATAGTEQHQNRHVPAVTAGFIAFVG